MNDPETIGILTKAGSPPAYMDVPQFAAYIEQDGKRLAAVVHGIGKVE